MEPSVNSVDMMGGIFYMKDKMLYALYKAIDYDNKHHCFKWFVAGFCTCTIFVELLILIKMF